MKEGIEDKSLTVEGSISEETYVVTGRTWSLVERRRIQWLFECSWLLESHLFWYRVAYDTGHVDNDYKWSVEPLLDLLATVAL